MIKQLKIPIKINQPGEQHTKKKEGKQFKNAAIAAVFALRIN